MGSLSGFRPPQFSEDEAWLPAWLRHCNFDQLVVKGIEKDPITFEQRVEELQFLQKGVSNGESLWEEGGCNIGQLFVSGTDSSPFSYAQSANNGVQFHLCLSSDGDSEDTDLTTDSRQTKSKCPFASQPQDSGILVQGNVKLSLSHNARAVNWSPIAELERPLNKTELLKHDENVDFSEVSAAVVELCIAASEALVINEVIESDSLENSSSASAILEASLQLKQARLEVWTDTFDDSTHITNEIDNLSDLDDITMESTFEDAGIPLIELSGNELSVSQVNGTFNSEYDEKFKHETAASATIHECFDDDKQKKVAGNPVCSLGTYVRYQDHCLRTVDAHAELRLSVSTERANATTENNSHETNVSSSPTMSCQDRGKDDGLPNVVKEQFKSRWFGGWTSKSYEKYSNVKHSIPVPFACETSFFSESGDAAPDENSFVQNHNKGAILAFQLSMPTQNFFNRAMGEMPFLQDVRSSNTSLVDPLCSVVPCSISENICSSLAINYEDKVNPGAFNITTECKKDNVLGTSPSDNEPALGGKTGMPIANIKESQNRVSRRFTSLIDYSKLLPSHTKLSRIDRHQNKSFFMERDIELTIQENRESVEVGTEVSNKGSTHMLSHLVNKRKESHSWASNSSTDNKENLMQTALPESSSRFPDSENLQLTLLQCGTQITEKLRSSKRVHFCENELDISDNKKLRNVQTTLKTCFSTRTSKRSTRSTAHLESGSQHMDKFIKSQLDKEKRLIFQNMEFLLTGFSQKKEKEIEGLIRKYGGIVLYQLPSTNLKKKRSYRFKSPVLPIVLCLKKIQSFKFLYGCAVNAYLLKVNWLNDSIKAGFVLPPKRYMIMPRNISRRQDQVYTVVSYNTHSLVFNNLGVMLHGKTKCFTNIATIIKHGGGHVFRTLQRLVQAIEAGRVSKGIVVSHEVSCASRHLKHCALEQNIAMTSVQWIIKSLYAGQLISLEEKTNSRSTSAIKLQRHQDSMELSQEI